MNNVLKVLLLIMLSIFVVVEVDIIGKIVWVLDGDIVEILVGNVVMCVRFNGIDVFEKV